MSIRFDAWMVGMKDEKNHTISGIAEDGLQPIHKFVLEENFRQLIAYGAFGRKFLTPKIEVKIEPFGPVSIESQSYILKVLLDTRHGCYVYFTPGRFSPDAIVSKDYRALEKKGREIADRLKQYYDVDIIMTTGKATTRLSSWHTDLDSLNDFRTLAEGGVYFVGLDESKMKKWMHPIYGIKYLLYDGGKGKRYAHSIQNDKMFETYGIRKLYSNAPATNITLQELTNYVIVGL